MYLLCGLGNFEKKYLLTRHNFGFLIIDTFCANNNIKLKEQPKFEAALNIGNIENKEILLVKPYTYMNNSGRALRKVIDFYKIELEKILVIADDINLPFGELRLRANGGAGGHNGLKSVIQYLNTQNFARLRCGINANPENISLENYVLSEFSKSEKNELAKICDIAALACKSFVCAGIVETMNEFNKNFLEKINQI